MTPILEGIIMVKNNPNLAGQRANKKELFGTFGRYAVYAIHTRFDFVEWIVTDAENMDELTNLPTIIRQADTKEKAMQGLI